MSLAAPADAARVVDMTASDAGGEYWFDVQGTGGRNPDLVFRPGQEVWVDMRSAGREHHNIHFSGPVDNATALAPPGHSLALRFTVPEEEGDYEYWCDPHRELGMRGTFRISATAVEESPAAGAPLAVLAGLAILGASARRMWSR